MKSHFHVVSFYRVHGTVIKVDANVAAENLNCSKLFRGRAQADFISAEKIPHYETFSLRRVKFEWFFALAGHAASQLNANFFDECLINYER